MYGVSLETQTQQAVSGTSMYPATVGLTGPTEVGIVYGHLIFNVESPTSNQQFYVKSREKVVKKWQSNLLLCQPL